MFTLVDGDVRPASAFLLFTRGLTEGVGDGASRGGLGGYWEPGSLTVSGDVPFLVGLGGLESALLSTLVSLFNDSTSASLSAPADFCRVSLYVRKLSCNTEV